MSVDQPALRTGNDVEASVDARVGHAGTRIDLDEVGRTYRIGNTTVTALDDVNLHVDEAAFTVVLGPSESGQTTLLDVIGALDRPTAGSVRVAGIDLTNASANERAAVRRTGVSFVF